MPIQILPEELAAKIAAGEVIERPASVVKELVENALDGGARDVRIEVRGGGQRLLRVADDGSGIPFAQVPLAFARHGTSKLTSADELFCIRTLGFRGEALPSIAAVARVTMITRTAEETSGTLFKIENGQVLAHAPHGAPRGTVVTVEELFRNVPARLKFLKAPGAESAHIAELVHAYALARPDVRFSLVTDGKLVFHTSGNGRLRDVLLKVFGAETAREMIEVTEEETTNPQSSTFNLQPPITVRGYISPPSIHRSTRKMQYLFVNGRWIEDRALSHAVLEAYHTLLMVGRHPLFVLKLELPYEAVDVNVHPTKMQVRFREPGEIYRSVQRTVRRALTSHFPIPSLGSPLERSSETMGPRSASGRDTVASRPVDSSFFPVTAAAPDQAPLNFARPPDGMGLDSSLRSSLPMLRVLGQIASTYIICEGPDGLYLVDQHAAHERVLYEQWMARRVGGQATGSLAQELLEPVIVELSPLQWAVWEEQREWLHNAGFRIEPFGGQTVLVRAVPDILSRRDPRTALVQVLDQTDEGGAPLEQEGEARLILTICKSAAVKGGQILSLEEMRALIRDLERTSAPRTCPHGRPTMVRLDLAALAREFGRRG